jgi:hypothetical protein
MWQLYDLMLIQSQILSLKQLPLLCHLDPLSMLIWCRQWIIHTWIAPLAVTRSSIFFISGLYVRWDFTGFRTWKKVDNLLLTEMKKDVGKWDGNIKLHSRLCYWRSHIARFFCLLLPPLLKSSLLLAPLDVFNYK